MKNERPEGESCAQFTLTLGHMGVSKNNGTPKSSILMGFSHHKPSILGYPYFWKHPYSEDWILLILEHRRHDCGSAVGFDNPRRGQIERKWKSFEIAQS